MDTRERIQGFLREDMRTVSSETKSAMPAFGADKLSDAELDDLLAYLESAPGYKRDAVRRSLRSLYVSTNVCANRGRGARGIGIDGDGGGSDGPAATGHCAGAPSTASRATDRDWLMFGGSYTNQRHSPLTQITPENVSRLAAAVGVSDRHCGQVRDDAAAASTTSCMSPVRTERRDGPSTRGPAARSGATNASCRRRRSHRRAAALVNTRLRRCSAIASSWTTLDAHLLALNMKTGAVVWDAIMADYKIGYSGTRAPLVVKDKVIVGVAGGEYGIRGFIDAYDTQTGERAWRWYTIPGPGEPGNDTWQGRTSSPGSTRRRQCRGCTGAYDPELNLLSSESAILGPTTTASSREGRQPLHRDSPRGARCGHGQAAVALPVHTARYFTIGTRSKLPILADLTIGGQLRKVVHAGESKRILLHARSEDRKAHRRTTVRGDDVGEGGWRRRTPCDAARLMCLTRKAH